MLRGSLTTLGEYGLKLKMFKCKLFQRKLTYLGHVVSAAGVEPDPEKTKVLEHWSLTHQRIHSNFRRSWDLRDIIAPS